MHYLARFDRAANAGLVACTTVFIALMHWAFYFNKIFDAATMDSSVEGVPHCADFQKSANLIWNFETNPHELSFMRHAYDPKDIIFLLILSINLPTFVYGMVHHVPYLLTSKFATIAAVLGSVMENKQNIELLTYLSTYSPMNRPSSVLDIEGIMVNFAAVCYLYLSNYNYYMEEEYDGVPLVPLVGASTSCHVSKYNSNNNIILLIMK